MLLPATWSAVLPSRRAICIGLLWGAVPLVAAVPVPERQPRRPAPPAAAAISVPTVALPTCESRRLPAGALPGFLHVMDRCGEWPTIIIEGAYDCIREGARTACKRRE